MAYSGLTCEQVSELLGPYNDDDLPTEARLRMEAHLLRCEHCAWEALSLQITRARLRDGIGETVAPDAFRARLLARLKTDNEHLQPDEPVAHDPYQYPLPIGL
jgi:anti-sigma factor RsiW